MSEPLADNLDLHGFLRVVVAAEMPSELELFDIAGPELLEGNVAPDETAPTRYGAIGNPELILEFVKLASATVSLFAAVLSIRYHRHGKEPAELGRKWAEYMVKQGFTGEKAARIASKFEKDLRKVVASLRAGK